MGACYFTLEREGIPALWVPRRLVQVNCIPMLASGKVDLAKCGALADLRNNGGPVGGLNREPEMMKPRPSDQERASVNEAVRRRTR